MLSVLAIFLIAAAVLLSIPTAILLVEVVAATAGRRKDQSAFLEPLAGDARAAILVPAHDESTSLVPTLRDIKQQLDGGDRLIVIADNCSDDTASLAAAMGAEVIARDEPTRIGKGFALDWGIGFLRSNPPDFVVFIDSDCRVHPDAIARLKSACHSQRRPLQAVTLMKADAGALPDYGLSEFAWIIRNWVRPLGLWNLHCPSQLTGTGMIVPWDALQKISIANASLAEDLQFGLDLAAAGTAAHFLPHIVCSSEFPTSPVSKDIQQQRWVTGHINTTMETFRRYLPLAIRQRNADLLLLCLDMAIPPLTLLAAIQGALVGVSWIIWLIGISSTPLIISGVSLSAFSLSVFLAWLNFGRDVLTARSASGIVPRIAATLRMLAMIFAGRAERRWIRTERGKDITKTRACDPEGDVD